MRKVLSKSIFIIIIAALLFSAGGKTANAESNAGVTVYITNTGECYHRYGCSYLKSCIETTLEDAVYNGYRPCSRCNPPVYGTLTEKDTYTYYEYKNPPAQTVNAAQSSVTAEEQTTVSPDSYSILEEQIPASSDKSHITASAYEEDGQNSWFWYAGLGAICAVFVMNIWKRISSKKRNGIANGQEYPHKQEMVTIVDVPSTHVNPYPPTGIMVQDNAQRQENAAIAHFSPKPVYSKATTNNKPNTPAKKPSSITPVNQFPALITDALKIMGLEYYDKRPKGGSLWIVGPKATLESFVRLLEQVYGIAFFYTPRGGKTTSFRGAWYSKPKNWN